MNKVKESMIIKLTDTFDEAAMLYYHATIDEEIDNTAVTNYDKEKGRLNYYECLLTVIDYFLEIKDIEESHLDDETKEKISTLFSDLDEEIEKESLNSEEVRRALLLLDIKGFKNLNFSLDLITPDNVGFIITKLVERLIANKKFSMLDFNFGIGNLAFTVVNNLDKDINLIGIDNHALMSEIAIHKANLMQEDITLFHQDALEYLPKDIDLVISDLATYDYINDNYKSELYDKGVRYFPYLAIEHYLNLQSDTKYIYIIDNNFFSQKGSEDLRKILNEKATMKAFITLPTDMFQSAELGKALLVLENKPSENKNVEIFMLPSIKNKEAFLNTITPDYIVISSSEDNSYKIPKIEIVERLLKYTDKVYATFINGNIVFTSKNNQIDISFEKTNVLIKDSNWYQTKIQ